MQEPQVEASARPKWAALLETSAPSTLAGDADGTSTPSFPGLGKTQAGNILASLASQPLAAAKEPAVPAPAASPAAPVPPASPAASMVAAADGPQAQRSRPATSPLPPGDNAGAPTPGAPAPPGGAAAANNRSSDNAATGPDPGSDDILPSKPRASLRLRPNFRLPHLRLPKLRPPKFRPAKFRSAKFRLR